MPNNITEDEQHRKQRTQNTRDNDAIVMTADNEKDMFKERIFDIGEIINTSHDETAIKLRRLKEVGVTDEMIISAYKDLSGSVETEETALSTLETIFTRLAVYISLQPNGIVIDMNTGKIDVKASMAQAVEVGIELQTFNGTESVEMFLEVIKTIEKKEFAQEEFTQEEFRDYVFLLKNFNFRDFKSKEVTDVTDAFMIKNIEEMHLSEISKNLVQKDRDFIENSKYEEDPFLFEITQLELQLEASKGTPIHNVISDKCKKFYREHEEYKGKVPIRDENNNIVKEEEAEFIKYKDAYTRQFIFAQVESAMKISPEEFSKLSQDKKSTMIMSLFSGWEYSKKKDPELKEVYEECKRALKNLMPELDLDNIGSSKAKKQLAQIVENQIGIKIEGKDSGSKEINITSLCECAVGKINELVTEAMINDQMSISDLKNMTMDINEIKSVKKSPFANYFEGSKIQFTKEDEKEFNSLYKMVNINSWIEDKDTALKLRYAALFTMKKEYENLPDNEYTKQKKLNIERQLSEFEAEHGKIGMDGDDLSIESKYDLGVYREYAVNTGLTKFFTRDAIDLQRGISYQQLDDNHKKAYIRNILVALKYADMDPEFCFSKLVLRRLELMNTEDKTFVTFDENGDFTLNKELILEEYQSMSSHKWNSYEELLQSFEKRKDEYVLKKLEEYSKLRDEDFLKLDDKGDYTRSIEQIEERRAQSNGVRVQQNQVESEDTRKPQDNIPIPDAELMEGLKKAGIPAVELNASAIEAEKEKKERETRVADQEENDERNIDKSRPPVVKSETLDNSLVEELQNATQPPKETQQPQENKTINDNENEKVGIIKIIKKIVNDIRIFISSRISGRNLLGAGNEMNGYVENPSNKADNKNSRGHLTNQSLSFDERMKKGVPPQADIKSINSGSQQNPLIKETDPAIPKEEEDLSL